jgi:hypothetical protein
MHTNDIGAVKSHEPTSAHAHRVPDGTHDLLPEHAPRARLLLRAEPAADVRDGARGAAERRWSAAAKEGEEGHKENEECGKEARERGCETP